MATRRRVNPELMRAFESAQVEPFDFETPGRVVDVPVPPEHFEQPQAPAPVAPRSRFDVVRDYLEQSRQPMPQPNTPEVDVRAAADFDNRRNLGQSMLAAGQAFTGNRRAMPQVTSAAETQAMAEREARKRELEQWAATKERQRMQEAGVLSQALVEPSRKDPELERERLENQRKRDEQTGELGARKLDLEERKLDEKGKPKPKKDTSAKDASALRKEFDSLPEVKSFKDVSIGMDKIRTAAKSGTAPGDMALIFAFMKILDPGSSVKEGEYASAKDAQGVPDKVRTAYNKALAGEILAPDTRAAFVKESEGLYETERARYSAAAQRYRGLAERQKLTPDDVAMDRPGAAPETPDIPPKGSVMVVDIESGAVMPLSPAAAAAAIKAGKARAQ